MANFLGNIRPCRLGQLLLLSHVPLPLMLRPVPCFEPIPKKEGADRRYHTGEEAPSHTRYLRGRDI
jgi:hypothetical protein